MPKKYEEGRVCKLCDKPFYGKDLCKYHYMMDYRATTGVRYSKVSAKPRDPQAFWNFVVSELGIVGASTRTKQI